jgi:hypothetical protein
MNATPRRLEEMLKRNKEFDGLRAGTPAPTEESRKQIEERKKTATASVNKLRGALTCDEHPSGKNPAAGISNRSEHKDSELHREGDQKQDFSPPWSKGVRPFLDGL